MFMVTSHNLVTGTEYVLYKSPSEFDIVRWFKARAQALRTGGYKVDDNFVECGFLSATKNDYEWEFSTDYREGG